MPYWQITFINMPGGAICGTGSFDFIPPPGQPNGTIPWRSQGMRSYSFTFNLPPPFNPIQFADNTFAATQAGYITYNAQQQVTAVTAQLTAYDNSNTLTTLQFQKIGPACNWTLTNTRNNYGGTFGIMPVTTN